MKVAQFAKSLTVALRPEIFEQIKQITDEQCISMAEWTRTAIDNALAKHQRKEETM